MATSIPASAIARKIRDVAQAPALERSDFMALLRRAGLDPAMDLRGENWAGANFSGRDLSGCDFTGARLHGCNFRDAQISRARLDQAELGQILHYPGQDPELPPACTPLANPWDAADWDKYTHAWRKGRSMRDDSHLATGAIFQDAPFAPQMVVIPSGNVSAASTASFFSTSVHYRLAVGRGPLAVGEFRFFSDPRPAFFKRFRDASEAAIVSRENATNYCRWLSDQTGQPYRLLSDVEFYYCFRGRPAAAIEDRGHVYYELLSAWTKSYPKKLPNPWGL
jgi:hypothetical protein